MLHQIIFLAFYLGLLPAVLLSPFAGVLIYYWLDWLPPDQVYSVTLLPDYLSFATGALAFFVWLLREKKTVPRPTFVLLLMAAFLIWTNITWQYALVPNAGWFYWDRTIKVIGFAILTAQMLSTRERLEAFVWTFVLSVTYFALPNAIKVIVSGGSGGIGAGEVVVAAAGSFFGDRVIISVVMAMAVPFALYLGRHATLLPARWARFLRPAMLGLAGACLIASIGTFARTAVFASGATLFMLGVRARRKIAATLGLAATILALLAVAPDNWFARMNTIVHYQRDNSALSRLSAWKWAWHFTLQHPLLGGGFGVFHLDAGSITGRPGWVEAHNIFFQVMAEQGFVGLGIFCCVILAIYHSCTVVQKRVRGHEEVAWTADLARATQISLAAYVAGGMFVSIATAPFLYILAGLAIGTRSLVDRELAAGRPDRSVVRTPGRRRVAVT
jgi:probable O-glycosylation ligase (exosortase A-associated)